MRDRQKRNYLNRRSTHPFRVGDVVLLKKHQGDKMDLKSIPNYRAAKFVNHPDNLPDIEPIPNYDKSPDKSDAGTKYNLRKYIKGPTKLDL